MFVIVFIQQRETNLSKTKKHVLSLVYFLDYRTFKEASFEMERVTIDDRIMIFAFYYFPSIGFIIFF